MTTIELSANQRHVLEMAQNTSGYVEDYPTGLLGGARTSVVRALLRNDMNEVARVAAAPSTDDDVEEAIAETNSRLGATEQSSS